MVNEEILGGLKLALAKGESLEQAMSSFYNANYNKEEIEEAAVFLNSQPTQPIQQKTISKTPKKQTSSVKKINSKRIRPKRVRPQRIRRRPRVVKPRQVRSVQNVSNYGNEKKKPEGTVMTIILVFFLLILLVILTAVFLFKTELIEFFNNLI